MEKEDKFVEKGTVGKIPEVHFKGVSEDEVFQVLMVGMAESADRLRVTATRSAWLLVESTLSSISCLIKEIEKLSLDQLRLWAFPKKDTGVLILFSFRSDPKNRAEKIAQLISNNCGVRKALFEISSDFEAYRHMIFNSLAGFPIAIKSLRGKERKIDELIISESEMQKGYKTMEDLLLRIEESGLVRVISLDSLLLNGEPIGFHAKIYVHPQLNREDFDPIASRFFEAINSYLKKKYSVELKDKKVFSESGNMIEILMS
ncbi:MAG: hypothetical protein ACP5O5_06120 [Fervidicoccaceae archaeon]